MLSELRNLLLYILSDKIMLILPVHCHLDDRQLYYNAMLLMLLVNRRWLLARHEERFGPVKVEALSAQVVVRDAGSGAVRVELAKSTCNRWLLMDTLQRSRWPLTPHVALYLLTASTLLFLGAVFGCDEPAKRAKSFSHVVYSAKSAKILVFFRFCVSSRLTSSCPMLLHPLAVAAADQRKKL